MNPIRAVWRWIRNLFSKKSIEEVLQIKVAWTAEQMQLFEDWRNAYNGTMQHNAEFVSQLTAAGVCSRIAKLVLLEFKTSTAGSAMADYLNEQYTRFVNKMPNGLRDAVNMGLYSSRYLLYPYEHMGKIETMVLGTDSYFPTKHDETGQLVGVVVPIGQEKDDTYYTLLVDMLYSPKERTYSINYTAWVSKEKTNLGKSIPLTEVEEWAQLQDVTFQDVEQPWFVEYVAPTDAAVFAKALDTFRKIDKLENQTEWEFDGAERAVFTPAGMFRDVGYKDALHPENSTVKLAMPKGKERLYMQTNITPDALKKPETYQPVIRDENYRRRMNDLYIEVENKCELARGTISDVNNVEHTATEIEATRQVTFTTVADIQKATETALRKLIASMTDIAWRYYLAPMGVVDATFDWQDSILQSQEEQRTELTAAQTNGWISAVEGRMWFTGEDRETAEKNIPSGIAEG